MKKSSSFKRLIHLCFALLLFVIPVVVFASTQILPAFTSSVGAAPLYQTQRTVSFTSSAFSVNENQGPADITVQINPAITDGTIVTVDYLTVPGSATPGTDYVTTSGTLTFTSAANIQTFAVTIVDDNIFEPDETVNLILRNPVNAELSVRDTAVLTIRNDDTPPTNTPTPTRSGSATPVFVDAYEPNNTLGEAYTTAADAPQLCNATLWPTGDEDYFRFTAKAGSFYLISTQDLSAGLDTVLTVYNTEGAEIARNDDVGAVGERRSEVRISPNVDGFYFARVVNKDPTDPANKTYCFNVESVAPATPETTPLPGDTCEFNSTFDTACTIGDGETKSLSFVPTLGSQQDTDVLRLWVKPGITYTCETHDLSPVTDTNIILYNHDRQPFNPWIGNDDRALGDRSSLVAYHSTYTGWLYIMIGPVNPPPYEEAPLHTYQATCTSAVPPTATPTIAPTVVVPPPGGGVPPLAPTPTPLAFPTQLPTPTPFDLSFLTPSPSPTPPIIQIQPLPTATAFAGGQQVATINVTLYYDSNFNFMPELTEGIAGVAVALYDNATGGLVAFGYTNEAGSVGFDSIVTSGAVRVVVPFLNYNQVIVGSSSNILLRVAPQPLPIGIP